MSIGLIFRVFPVSWILWPLFIRFFWIFFCVPGPRLDNRLGQGNWRTDVQPIRGQATDEPMSTDLDCTKSRLLCVQKIMSILWSSFEVHYLHILFTHVSQGLMVRNFYQQNEDHVQGTYLTLTNKNQVKSWSLTVHPDIAMSLSYKSTVSPSVVSKSSSVTSVTYQISLSSADHLCVKLSFRGGPTL